MNKRANYDEALDLFAPKDGPKKFLYPKAEWGPGPWNDEHDHYEGNFAANEAGIPRAFRWMVTRGPAGQLNGYVAVPKDHLAWRMDYDDLDVVDPVGLTFCGHMLGYEIRDPELWWFGFDNAHHMDIAPALEAQMRAIYVRNHDPDYRIDKKQTYKDFNYARAQVLALATALASLDPLREP